jgi:hypothetical protein
LSDSERSIAARLLQGIIQSAEKIATETEFSSEQMLDHVRECERKIGQLQAVMGSPQEMHAKDGVEAGTGRDALRSDARINGLMRQADESVRRCMQALSARQQSVSDELKSMRLMQRATKAYQGIETG